MKKKRRLDDYMETVKMLSDIYYKVPKELDCMVWERTEWTLLGCSREKRKKILVWLNEKVIK